jgi:hypothetical protein
VGRGLFLAVAEPVDCPAPSLLVITHAPLVGPSVPRAGDILNLDSDVSVGGGCGAGARAAPSPLRQKPRLSGDNRSLTHSPNLRPHGP